MDNDREVRTGDLVCIEQKRMGLLELENRQNYLRDPCNYGGIELFAQEIPEHPRTKLMFLTFTTTNIKKQGKSECGSLPWKGGSLLQHACYPIRRCCHILLLQGFAH